MQIRHCPSFTADAFQNLVFVMEGMIVAITAMNVIPIATEAFVVKMVSCEIVWTGNTFMCGLY